MKKTIVYCLCFFFSFGLSFQIRAEEKLVKELLELSLEELLDVEVVTATKTPKKLTEVPATVRVITAAQIKERGYMTLEDALADLPGFQFRNIIGFNTYSFMRGVPSQNNALLLMVDGVLINELNSGGYYGGAHINLVNVKAIEVVYGPASALYGTNAMSGIINVITNDPKDIEKNSISVLGGNFNTVNVDFKAGSYTDVKDIGYSLSGMYKQGEKADIRGHRGDYNWTDSMENFEDDVSFDGKFLYKNFSAGIVFQDKSASRATNYKSYETDYRDYGTDWHIRFINTYARYKLEKSKIWSMLSQVYYRNASVMDDTIAYIKDGIDSSEGQVGYYRPNYLAGFENQVNFVPKENLEIIAGIVAEEERLASSFSKSYSGSPDIKPPAPQKPDMTSNHLVSVYVQAQQKFLKYYELTLGFRHDNSNYYGKVNTPRIGVVCNRDKVTTKLLYMQAFRAPKPWDYTFGKGNPDLDPEKMRSLELSAAYSFTDYCIGGLAVYHNSIEGKFENHIDEVVNGNKLDTDGIETSIEFAWNTIHWYANYTYTFSQWENGSKVPEIGTHSCNTGILYTIINNLKLNIRGNYLSDRKNPSFDSTGKDDYVDDYFIMNSVLSLLDFYNFDFQVILNNIFDVHYYHTSNRPPTQYRQPQRQLMFKAGYSF